jgi:hypothetical protein
LHAQEEEDVQAEEDVQEQEQEEEEEGLELVEEEVVEETVEETEEEIVEETVEELVEVRQEEKKEDENQTPEPLVAEATPSTASPKPRTPPPRKEKPKAWLQTQTRWLRITNAPINMSQDAVVELVENQDSIPVKQIVSVIRLYLLDPVVWLVRAEIEAPNFKAKKNPNAYKDFVNGAHFVTNLVTINLKLMHPTFKVLNDYRRGAIWSGPGLDDAGIIPHQIEEPTRTLLVQEVNPMFTTSDLRWFFKEHKLAKILPVQLIDNDRGFNTFLVRFESDDDAAQAYRMKMGINGACMMGSRRVFLRRFY